MMSTFVPFDDDTLDELTDEQKADLLGENDRYEEIFWGVDPAIRPYIKQIKDKRIRLEIWGVVNHVIRYAYQAGGNDAAEGS